MTPCELTAGVTALANLLACRLGDAELNELAALLERVIKGWKEDGVPERELFAPGDKR